MFCQVNVTDDASVDAGFAKSRAAIGQERILVNCAGTGNAIKTASRDKNTGEISHFPLDKFNLIVQINLVGTFRCIAKSAAGMMTLDPIDGERGAIVNTASVAAEDGQIGQAAYSASKGGVVGMTLPIARDLSRELIRVNTILPGIFNTPLLQGAPEPVKQALGAQVPHPARLGNPEEYASLATEMIRNAYFNGEDVRLDGAIRMALDNNCSRRFPRLWRGAAAPSPCSCDGSPPQATRRRRCRGLQPANSTEQQGRRPRS